MRGVLALLGLCFLGFLLSNYVHHDGEGSSSPLPNAETNPSNTTVSQPSLAPIPLLAKDSASVMHAMTTCDEEAARNPNGLYFLVTPVIPASFESATLLISPGEDYGTFLLISSHELVSGLENNSLELSARKSEILCPQYRYRTNSEGERRTPRIRSSRTYILSGFQNSKLASL